MVSDIFTIERLRLVVARRPKSIQNNFKIQTMNTVCLQGRRMRQTTRKRIKSTTKSIQRWIPVGGSEGVCISVSLSLLDSLNILYWVLFHVREAREEAELAKHRAERPKLQQQFADLKRGLSVVTDAEWENIPEVGNLTRKKRRKDERSFVVPDSVIVGDRAKGEYENSLDSMQQEVSTTWMVDYGFSHYLV